MAAGAGVAAALCVIAGVIALELRGNERRRSVASPVGAPVSERKLHAAPVTPRSRLSRAESPARGRPFAWISIPSIGVRAPVVRLGLNRDGTLQVPARSDQTGWWSGGARPGQRGSAVIAGHVDSTTGPAVFFRLRQLHPGDSVRVTYPNGPSVGFIVTGSQRASKAHFPTERVYAPTSTPTLRLITCSGAFDEHTGHYKDNLIVFGRPAAA